VKGDLQRFKDFVEARGGRPARGGERSTRIRRADRGARAGDVCGWAASGTLALARAPRLHPFGVGFAAELRRLGGGAGLPAAIEGEAVVRLSRSLGAPEWLPDPCGLALRVPDAYGPGRHQDLLLASSGLAPLARHLLLSSGGFCDRAYSSILPYRLAGETVVALTSAWISTLATNSGGGLEHAGWLNRLRGPSYGASQAGAEAYASHHQAGVRTED
jgi:hypothetical protein